MIKNIINNQIMFNNNNIINKHKINMIIKKFNIKDHYLNIKKEKINNNINNNNIIHKQ